MESQTGSESDGLRCRKCGYPGSRVLKTTHYASKVLREGGGGNKITMTRRLRRCLHCGQTFFTREFLEDEDSGVGNHPEGRVANTIPANPIVGSGTKIPNSPIIEPKVPASLTKKGQARKTPAAEEVKKLPPNPFLDPENP